MSEHDELAQSAPVLLVDDTPGNLLALEAVLASLKVPLVAVGSGKEALAWVEKQSFAVALLDVQMPDMDGFELIQRFRQTKHGAELPVLLVTAIHRDEVFARKGYASGAADYITKPYDAQVIRARVKAFIDLYRQREAVRRGQVALRTQERDEAIRRLVAFERIASAALETNNLEALLVELLNTFIDAADAADSATILLREGDFLRVAASVGLAEEVLGTARIRIGQGFAGLIAAERRPLEVDDDALCRVVQTTSLSSVGVRALYGVPLLRDGQVLGVAHIGSKRSSQFSEPEKRLFLAAADRAALAVARQLETSVLTEVLEAAPAFIAIVSVSTGTYTFANAPMRQLFDSDLSNTRFAERGFGPEALRAIQDAEASAETVEIAELRIPGDAFESSQAVPSYVRFTAQPLRNLSGSVDRVLIFAIDIAPQVQGRRAIEQAQLTRARLLDRERAARRAAESASMAKDEFLATVSHELRTPLNAILGWASIARSRPDADTERALAVIERNARAQARIVEDVLDFSRMSKGKMRLAMRNVALDEIIGGALESVRPAAEARSVSIQLDLRVFSPVIGDPERLQQVAWNLLSNAVKFSSPGGRVEVRAHTDENTVRVSVTDHGQGIEPEFLPHVFEPFRQANGSTTRRHGGLGLGLAIVRQIVQAHGGTIEARSGGLGRGATFSLELPLHDAQLGEQPAEGTPESEPKEPYSSDLRLDGLRVLVIDDDDDGRELLTQALSSRGAEVISVASASVGLSELQRTRPDVLVSDIAMPDVDGYEFVRRVRQLPAERGGETPALAITAHAGKEVLERAIGSGFHRYASKPIDVERFVATVAELGRETSQVDANP
ncbi:MAG TPA: response regulator [Polyangiaceae bacterium]|nr:response regulator [Polyangiaceae bacterium]